MMAENKPKKGLLQRKVNGAFQPEKPATETNSTSTPQVPRKQKTTKKFANQIGSVKIPEETKLDLAVIKNMEKIKFDYEAIQLLIDRYVTTLSAEDQRRFTVLRENL